MKVRYYSYVPIGRDGTVMNVSRNSLLIDAPESTVHGFNKYLLSAIQSDFPAHHPKDCDAVLHDIDRLERGEIAKCLAGTVDTFTHTLTPTKVTFEHSIFGECPEWPLWSCTLAQYKAALQGWRKFIDMPKSIDTELIVELPEGDAGGGESAGC